MAGYSTEQPREPIGLRVARWRDIAGMTQQQLADLVSVELGRPFSRHTVSMIETDKRPVVKRTVLIALTNALKVSVTNLTGQPYPPTARGDLDAYRIAPAIRTALDDPEELLTPRPIEQLAFAADRAMAARMACDLPGIGAHLPDLLADTRALFDGEQDERAGVLFVQAAVTGSLALKPIGFIDLALRLAQFAATVAAKIGDPVCIAAAKFALAQCALATGGRVRSYRIASAALSDLDRGSLRGPQLNDQNAWLTMLHLHAALTAASLHRADDADAHLAAADETAAQVVGDPWRVEASEANVATWRVGVALENGDAELAPTLARRVDPTKLRTKQRQARLYFDTARGLFIADRHAEAVRAFLRADDIAPGDLRNRPAAVEMVGHMARAVPARGGSDALRELAQRVGIDPFAPPVPT